MPITFLIFYVFSQTFSYASGTIYNTQATHEATHFLEKKIPSTLDAQVNGEFLLLVQTLY